MPILGLVQNMNGLICPHCNREIPFLGKDGGTRTAQRMDVHPLGSLPFDPRVVQAADKGKSLLDTGEGGLFMDALERLTVEVLSRCGMGNDHFEETRVAL